MKNFSQAMLFSILILTAAAVAKPNEMEVSSDSQSDPSLLTENSGSPAFAELYTNLQKADSKKLTRSQAKEFLGKLFNLPFFPINELVHFEAGEKAIEIHFDFGNQKEKTLRIPESKVWTLKRKDLEVEKSVLPERTTMKGHTIIYKKTIVLKFDEKGIINIRPGDMKGRKYGMTLPLQLRTQWMPGKILTHKGRVVLQEDEHGNPILKKGRYLPQRYDNWIIIEAPFKQSFEVPLPKVKSRRKSTASQ